MLMMGMITPAVSHVGALAAGVSLMFQTAGVGRSNEEPIQRWIDQVIRAEAFVLSGSLTSPAM